MIGKLKAGQFFPTEGSVAQEFDATRSKRSFAENNLRTFRHADHCHFDVP